MKHKNLSRLINYSRGVSWKVEDQKNYINIYFHSLTKKKKERERENSIKFALQILNAFKYILNIMKERNDATIIMIQMYT